MPSPQIQFPANFTTASAIAFTNPDGSVQLVSADNPVPVTMTGGGGGSGGGLTDAELRAVPVPVSLSSFGGVTDVQLRAAPLPVSLSNANGLTDGQLRAAPVAVSLPSWDGLTDTQLRASPVLVSLSGFGGLTETQLRATPVAVSLASFGGLTDTQLRASPVGVATDAVADALRTSGSVTSAAALVSVATTGFNGGSFHVTSAGTTCTITYEQSNDNSTWVALPVISLASATATPVLTTTAAGIYGFATSAAYVRARVSTYTSGTVALTLAQKRQGPATSGLSLAGGSAALGSVSVSGTATVSGTTNAGTGFTDSTTALAGGASFTGTGRATTTSSQYAYFHAVAYADQSGTLFIDQSLDSGATYQPVASQAVTASAPAQLTARLTGAFAATTLYRVRYVNGATAQATFRLSSAFSR
ncbi:hypothetical protein ACFOD9_02525 [Novosphingobium bradum]|uniref:Uncharacterized protein n=1 Tax=Novosphingobium bradum TaxID=1737444 RepID=A0ABV7IKK4_9SPHN